MTSSSSPVQRSRAGGSTVRDIVPPLLEARGLGRMRGGAVVVRDVSLLLREGEVLGLLGPNGAGKSTTLRMLAGTLAPHAGDFKIEGKRNLARGAHGRVKVGYLPQEVPLYNELTVKEHLNFVAELMKVHKSERRTAVERVMDRCDLEGVSAVLCGHLSTGFRKRVGIAAALVHSPRILLMDEPCTGLDPMQRAALRELLGELQDHHGVILSTHMLSEAYALCSKVLIMNQGRVAEEIEVASVASYQELEQAFLAEVTGDDAASYSRAIRLGQGTPENEVLSIREGSSAEAESNELPNVVGGW